jgi:hypothetical protein
MNGGSRREGWPFKRRPAPRLRQLAGEVLKECRGLPRDALAAERRGIAHQAENRECRQVGCDRYPGAVTDLGYE